MKTSTSARRPRLAGHSGGSGRRFSSQLDDAHRVGDDLAVVGLHHRHEVLAGELDDGRAVVGVDVDPVDGDRLVGEGQRHPLHVGGVRDPVDAHQLVVVQAAAGLAPKAPSATSSRRRGGHVGADGIADGHGDVEADVVQQRERPHRVARAERHAHVDVLRAHPGLVLEDDGAEEIGEEQAVDHEAGEVGHLDGDLVERLAQRVRALARAVARGGREGELDELHLRDRVEDVQADEAVLRAGGLREAFDRQRRGGAREQRVVGGDARRGLPSTRILTSWSSETASTTAVASPSAARSVSTRTWPALISPLSLPQIFATLPRARVAPSRPSAPTGRPPRRGEPPRPPARTRWRRFRLSRVVHARCHRSWLTGQSMTGNLRDTGSECATRKASESDEWSAGS